LDIDKKINRIMEQLNLPKGLRAETVSYMKDVISRLADNELLDNVDKAALVMLARNYDTFLIASEDVAKNGLTLMTVRGIL
jgi:phage terminase small subunit